MTARLPAEPQRRDERPLADLPHASITVYPDGPLIVRGDFALKHVDGTDIPAGSTVALCRCGRSAAKPLCDGSHARVRAVRGQDASGSSSAS